MAAATEDADHHEQQQQQQQQSYYEILGVETSATEKDITKAYRALAKEWHPDKNRAEDKATAEHMFSRVVGAYEVLSDAEARRVYDLTGTDPSPSSDGGSWTMSGFGGSPLIFACMLGDVARVRALPAPTRPPSALGKTRRVRRGFRVKPAQLHYK
jgi:DnaJ-class molecular chaperone